MKPISLNIVRSDYMIDVNRQNNQDLKTALSQIEINESKYMTTSHSCVKELNLLKRQKNDLC